MLPGTPMLRFLFPTLTPVPKRGQELFDSLVAEARQPHWFMEGQVPDTIDGRFALLATVLALAIVRLEQGDERAGAAAVALTERFVEAMDAEHRQLGVSDPAIGKHVRKLVTSLGRRVEQWRAAAGSGDWQGAAAGSVYAEAPAEAALEHTATCLRALWARLQGLADAEIAEGRIG